MNSDVTVTVTIPAYNAGRTLEASVNSVLAQTYSDWEILICDDCSTDNTYELACKLSERDSGIRVIRNEHNMKIAATRNRLTENAKGRYLALLDADDMMEPGKLAVQVEFLDNNPEYDFCATWFRTIDDNGSIRDWVTKHSGRIDKSWYLWGMPFANPSVMFKTASLIAAGGYLTEKTTEFRGEDYDLFMRMAAAGFEGYVIPEYLLIYYAGASALKRRKYRYRLDEAKMRYRNFKRLGLMPKGLTYAVKPLIAGLIPQRILNYFR
ncbi:MAG: glycosyltransferase family 2 protein [Oscillospiraceae bacterium]|jgi:glycosyltransferase involved in cell wall biosynthesis|nr:glycosyltransferase family 2 protein [Oscillospiraceae bacterium]